MIEIQLMKNLYSIEEFDEEFSKIPYAGLVSDWTDCHKSKNSIDVKSKIKERK